MCLYVCMFACLVAEKTLKSAEIMILSKIIRYSIHRDRLNEWMTDWNGNLARRSVRKRDAMSEWVSKWDKEECDSGRVRMEHNNTYTHLIWSTYAILMLMLSKQAHRMYLCTFVCMDTACYALGDDEKLKNSCKLFANVLN